MLSLTFAAFRMEGANMTETLALAGGVHWYRLGAELLALEVLEEPNKRTCSTCLHPPTIIGTIMGRNPRFYCVRSIKSKLREWNAVDLGWRPYGQEVPA